MSEWQCKKCGNDSKCPSCSRCENCDDQYHSRVMKEMVDRYEAQLDAANAHKQRARELLAQEEECGFEPSRGELWEFIREVGDE